MADRRDALFWTAWAFFGGASVGAATVRVTGGDTSLVTWGQLLGGVLVAGAATVGLVRGDAVTGDTSDVSPLVRVLAVAGALVYAAGIGLGFL